MPPTLRAGVILGLAVAAWTFVMGFTGWYRHPSLWILSWLVVPAQIGILLWTLRGLALTDGYGRQVWNGHTGTLIAKAITHAQKATALTVPMGRPNRDPCTLLQFCRITGRS